MAAVSFWLTAKRDLCQDDPLKRSVHFQQNTNVQSSPLQAPNRCRPFAVSLKSFVVKSLISDGSVGKQIVEAAFLAPSNLSLSR